MSLMNKAWSEVQKSVVLPVGTWRLRCKSTKFVPAKEDGKNDHIMIVYEAFEPCEDVDESSLAELGADYDYTMKPIFHRHWVKNEADLDKFRTLCSRHGVDVNDYENPLEAMKALKGTTVLGYLTQSQYKDNDPENTISAFKAE